MENELEVEIVEFDTEKAKENLANNDWSNKLENGKDDK